MSRSVMGVLLCAVIGLAVASCGGGEVYSDPGSNADVLSSDADWDVSDTVDGDVPTLPDAADVANPDVNPSVSVILEPSAVDFGKCAQNVPVTRQVILTNTGNVDIVLESVAITDPSASEFGDEFEVTGIDHFLPTGLQDTEVGPVQPLGSVVFHVTFTSKGPDAGDKTATLAITLGMPVNDTLEVPLEAHPETTPACRLQLVPSSMNFGTVAPGLEATRSMRLMNTGSGNCDVVTARIEACPAGDDGEPVCPEGIDGDSSGAFTFETDPLDIAGLILPGAFKEVLVGFSPSGAVAGLGPAGQVWARLVLTLHDDILDLTSQVPACAGACPPNLVGYGAAGQAKILPASVEFGLVTPECSSEPRLVCIYNTGATPVSLDSVSISGCSGEFSLPALEQLPLYVQSGQKKCIEVAYEPDGAGDDDCFMRLIVNGALDSIIDIPVSGVGYSEDFQTDEFIHQRSDAVDILFVLDDSGSMCDEVEALTDSFATFIERARVWNNDFHIGVINVDVTDPATAGRLNRGSTEGPRYLLPSPEIVDDFIALSGIGCDGSSFVESGLHAALTALMPPLTVDTTVECDDDSDCNGNIIICPDAEDCDYTCIDGTCAGFNKGFVRDDARLEVIVLSDEDDQSVLPAADYAGMLKDLKAGLGDDMVHLHAIVGVKDVPLPGDDWGDCMSAGGSSAMEGTRYIAAAEATGGVVGSICESSFDEAMLAISEKAFTDGGRLQFFLTRPADPAQISVGIVKSPSGGQYVGCGGGWEYDADSNSVILDPDGACVPEVGESVRVGYQVYCAS